MKPAETEIPDAHFTVDKQNISLWPRGKHQPLFRACSKLCAQTGVCWSFNKCSLLLPTEPAPKMGSPPILRKPRVVRAAAVILMLVLLASVLLQAIVCKSSAYSRGPAPSPGRQLLQRPDLSFLLSGGLSCLWLFRWPLSMCSHRDLSSVK